MAIWPDEHMPVDEFGNRADIIASSISTVNRSNPGRTHEQFVGAAGRDVIKRVRRAYGLPDMGVLTWEEIEAKVNSHSDVFNREQYEYILGFLKIVSKNKSWRKTMSVYGMNDGRWMKDLCHVIEDGNDPKGMYFTKPASAKARPAEIIRTLRNTPEYCPEKGKVTYTLPDGTVVTSEAAVLIGPNYYFSLEKTATDGSGTSITRLGHHGTPTRLTNTDKYSRPARETGTKTNGEAENRNLAKSVGTEPLADIMDMYNNPEQLKVIANNILTHPTPTNMEEVLSRETHKLGAHRPNAYMGHIHMCSGSGISRE